jgi:hypothetical protein
MMSEPTSSRSICLTDQQTMLIGQQHIPINADRYCWQTDDLWRILLAAARRTTIEAACADLERAPDSNTVRGYLTTQLSPAEIPALERQWNAVFRSLLPEWLARRPQEIAVDFHDEPYYGRSSLTTPIIGSVVARRAMAPPASTAALPPFSCSAMCD